MPEYNWPARGRTSVLGSDVSEAIRGPEVTQAVPDLPITWSAERWRAEQRAIVVECLESHTPAPSRGPCFENGGSKRSIKRSPLS